MATLVKFSQSCDHHSLKVVHSPCLSVLHISLSSAWEAALTAYRGQSLLGSGPNILPGKPHSLFSWQPPHMPHPDPCSRWEDVHLPPRPPKLLSTSLHVRLQTVTVLCKTLQSNNRYLYFSNVPVDQKFLLGLVVEMSQVGWSSRANVSHPILVGQLKLDISSLGGSAKAKAERRKFFQVPAGVTYKKFWDSGRNGANSAVEELHSHRADG
jgi:hypothetical protein